MSTEAVNMEFQQTEYGQLSLPLEIPPDEKFVQEYAELADEHYNFDVGSITISKARLAYENSYRNVCGLKSVNICSYSIN